MNFIRSDSWQSIRSKYCEDKNTRVFPLLVYYDDFECNNPLGSHSQKLGASYAGCPALPPECEGSIDNIFLCIMFETTDRIFFW